jgi:antitoxin PrlF
MDERTPKTKIAERLLTRPTGATMAEIIAAAGTPQYNELKKLASHGYRIRRVKEGKETRYFAERPVTRSFDATMTSKGQVTIPREIRERLRVRRGQKLRFTIETDNRVVMTPLFTRLSELAGILPKAKRTATIEEMNEAIGDAAVERFRRALRRDKR